MKIVEVWQDHHQHVFAIVKHSQPYRRRYNCKAYEALWLDDGSKWGELASFGGTPGFGTAEFDRVTEAREFLLKGIVHQDTDSEIWWKLVALSSSLERR